MLLKTIVITLLAALAVAQPVDSGDNDYTYSAAPTTTAAEDRYGDDGGSSGGGGYGGWGSPRQIHPRWQSTKCLDVRGNYQADGTPVQVYDCNGTGAQRWNIHEGTGQIRLADTNFCLDAGKYPSNGAGMKINRCRKSSRGQFFKYSDSRIRLSRSDMCLDLTDGDFSNGRQTQVWRCYDNNNNQVWNT